MKMKIFGKYIIGIIGGVILLLVIPCLFYPPEYIYRVLFWQESDAFDWLKFPLHELTASSSVYHFSKKHDPNVEGLFRTLADVSDLEEFLRINKTQSFIVIKDGKILYEEYFNNTQRDSIVTSFSVAKSITSALIGIAINDGYIKSVDDPISVYLPELAMRDPGFNKITIKNLLLMDSGLEYVAFRPFLFNGDDPLTTYFPDQRKIALNNTNIINSPGLYFNYNKYHPQLLGMILERTTGVTVTEYLQTKIWDKIGMEYDASWSIDSKNSNFEKMETGINARAIDFAKFGLLYVNDGVWEGSQVIPKEWVRESTKPDREKAYQYSDWVNQLPGQGYYKYMWWGMARDNSNYDYTAEGDKGQYIYISPKKKMVIIRNGIDYGISSGEWIELFYNFSSQY